MRFVYFFGVCVCVSMFKELDTDADFLWGGWTHFFIFLFCIIIFKV